MFKTKTRFFSICLVAICLYLSLKSSEVVIEPVDEVESIIQKRERKIKLAQLAESFVEKNKHLEFISNKDADSHILQMENYPVATAISLITYHNEETSFNGIIHLDSQRQFKVQANFTGNYLVANFPDYTVKIELAPNYKEIDSNLQLKIEIDKKTFDPAIEVLRERHSFIYYIFNKEKMQEIISEYENKLKEREAYLEEVNQANEELTHEADDSYSENYSHEENVEEYIPEQIDTYEDS